ncbi:patatin-like phospholipase family protein [Bermanella sp. WJH001]|uniref:patatin-like phospholipase family protein n=1 Tax=Bermanella sp. WJH001 TaxID=3048005 RepID=UPI0024BEA0EF|nr:patatin-like phospholipase family protein [Bermanella sp. WJH001]MDJ1539410.1 patatin-like phospholipase family protein [Bermanella sp. WJH001]
MTFVTRHIILVIALCLISASTIARPKIGLALGGGGAKGSAHIGVLKVLEQHNIPIDYIAGTSIGSVIGGMYATGLRADEIEAIMLSTPWAHGYSDQIPRQDLPWRIKQQKDQFNIPLEMGVKDYQIKMPSGLLYGQGATKLLREAIGEHPNFESFDDLAIPYRAIATDLVSYQSVVIDKGSLFAAMRASSSIPGALAPEEINGLVLVDGGITKNLPVDVVRDMGADIIIAVDIGSDLQPKAALKSTFAIISQLSSFLTSSNTIEQRSLLSDQDLLIKPDIDGLSTTDWSTIEVGINRGEQAAKQHGKQLIKLSLDTAEYDHYLAQVKTDRQRLVSRIDKPVNAITLYKTSSISDELILDNLNIELDKKNDAIQITQAIDRVYSIDKFQRVEALTIIEDEQKTLRVIAEEKSWGPNFLQFGIGWEDDLDSNSDLNFDIAYTMGNLTANGGELRSELEMGTQRSFDTEFYWPLDITRHFYSSSRYLYKSFKLNLYVPNNPLIPIDHQYHSISQGIGYNYIKEGFVELGLTTDLGKFSDPIFLEGSINYLTYGGYLKFGFDTLDSINFPTQGTYLSFSSYFRNEEVDDHSVIEKQSNSNAIQSLVVDLSWKSAVNFGNHAFVAKAAYSEAFTEDKNESIYISYLGGFLNLSGYQKDALVGTKKAFTAAIYQFDLGRSLFLLESLPLYLGLSLESGNVWQQEQNINHNDFVVSGSLYLGADTSLGPVALGYGRNHEDTDAFYFYLGKNF